jgi:hypothetical protein
MAGSAPAFSGPEGRKTRATGTAGRHGNLYRKSGASKSSGGLAAASA